MRKGFTLIELLIVIAIIAILALIAIPNFIEAQTRSKVSRALADMRSIGTAVESYFVDYNAYPRLDVGVTNEFHPFAYAQYLDKECEEGWGWAHYGGARMTTPIAYITDFPIDPFPHNAEGPYLYSECWEYSYHFYNFQGAAFAAIKNGGTLRNIDGPSGAGVAAKAPAPMKFNGPGGRARHAYWALWSCGPSRNVQYVSLAGGGAGQTARNFLNRPHHWDDMIAGGPPTYDPTNGTVSRGHIWRLGGASDI